MTETDHLPADIDLVALRERYRAERDRRRRTDGLDQYVDAAAALEDVAGDPWSDPVERGAVETDVDAVVVGAGFGGLVTAARLRRAGLADVRLVDRAGDVGGAWHRNRYPGLSCDVESYSYLPLLEELGTMPSRRYASGEEIRRHAQSIATHYDLYDGALLHTGVVSLTWDDGRSRWVVRTDRGDTISARYVALCPGPLERAKVPRVPGMDRFAGRMFHSSRWDYEYTGGGPTEAPDRLADQRVAVIGTGATGLQLIPTLSRVCGHLYVVQRTPSAVDERQDRATDLDWWRSIVASPGWQERRRENFTAVIEGRPVAEDMVGDRWSDMAPTRGFRRLASGDPGEGDPELVMEIADAEKMAELRDRIDEVVADPVTAAALKPWYRHLCKRPGFSDGYLEAFNRPSVSLLDTSGRGVDALTRDGIVVAGREYPVDAVVWATGYSVALNPVERTDIAIRGRGGQELRERWADGLRTFQGWVSHGFPNLFQIGGGQNSFSPNYVDLLDQQAMQVEAVVGAVAASRQPVVEPTVEAEDAWVAASRSDAVDLAGPLVDCTPGYYNDEGRPSRVDRYRGGPSEYRTTLRAWREAGDFSQVLTRTNS